MAAGTTWKPITSKTESPSKRSVATNVSPRLRAGHADKRFDAKGRPARWVVRSSVGCDVSVPQNIRFGFEIFQSILHHIADADNAGQVAVGDHNQMPHPV